MDSDSGTSPALTPTVDAPAVPTTRAGYCLPCATHRPLIGGPLALLAGYYCPVCGSYTTLPDLAEPGRSVWLHWLSQGFALSPERLASLPPAPQNPPPLDATTRAALASYARRHQLAFPAESDPAE